MFRSSKMPVAISASVVGIALLTSQATAAAAWCPNAGWVIVERKSSPDTRPIQDRPNHQIFVRRAQITTTADLTEIKLDGDAFDTQVQMKFRPDAAQRLHDATTNKSGLRIAFVVDDQVLSAVTWTGPYGMDADLGVQISLGRAEPQVRPLVESIQRCLASSAR
jgi:preprotein translocase subunit SecD